MGTDIFCRNCEYEYTDETLKECPECGDVHKIVLASGRATIGVEFEVAKMHAKAKGIKKKAWEYISKKTVRGDDGVTRVHHFRDINRIENTYEEKVTDIETGETIHYCKEKLTDHFGHGSAKKV